MNSLPLTVSGVKHWHDKGYKGKGARVAILDNHGEKHPNMNYATLVYPHRHSTQGDGWHHNSNCTKSLYNASPDAEIFMLNFWGIGADKKECIDWILENDIDIVSFSFSESRSDSELIADISRLLHTEIAVFCSSGNEGTAPRYPANWWWTISVGAYNAWMDTIPSYVNPHWDVLGVQTYILNSNGSPWVPPGTSFPCPFTAGQVACYVGHQKSQGVKPTRQMIYDFVLENKADKGFFALPEELEKPIKEGDDMLPYSDISKLRVTNPYGVKNSAYSAGYHTGIDFVSDGDKNIFAIQSGKVIRSTLYGAWGNFIVIQQEDGLSCVYAHLSKRYVNVGDSVAKGDLIGVEGSTGNSTGSHLHIELLKTYYDPLSSIDIAEYLGIKNTIGKVEGVVKVITVKSDLAPFTIDIGTGDRTVIEVRTMIEKILRACGVEGAITEVKVSSGKGYFVAHINGHKVEFNLGNTEIKIY